MSIVQNLKLLNKPINELAMLPQETIIQMAQAGQIPTAFVAPILGEKAEQAKAGANMAAMAAQQQMPSTTVLEGVIAQNAANQAVESMPAMAPMGQQMPMELPEDSGIAALPVSENMVPEYAGGGIVAFKAGDLVDGFDYNAATRDIDAASGVNAPDYSQFGSIGEELRRQEELRRLYLGDNTAARTELGGMEAAAQQQRAMRLLEAGLGIMGGESPYAFSNIAKGAQPALRGYAEDVAAQRKRKTELMGLERAEKAKLLDSVLEKQAKEEAAKIAAGKPTDMRNYVNDFVNSARAQGDDKTPEAVLRQRATENYLALQGAALQRANIAGFAAETTAQSKAREFADRARDNVDSSLAKNYNSPENKRLRDLQKQDREKRKQGEESNLAEQYLQDLYSKEEARIKGSDGKPKPEAGVKPEAGAKPDAAKPAAPPAPPSINVGNDITTERLTGAELEKRIAELKDHPNKDRLAKRLREAEAGFKKQIAAEKNPKKVTSQAEFDNLPEGTVYQLPNGVKGIKGGVAQSSVATPSPSAAAKPSIQSVKGAPAGATIGNLVEGKGYQVLDRNGKVIGYAR